MRSRVSVRGQTVIPREIRQVLGITPKDTLEWRIEDGVIRVFPIPTDPLRASLGILKGKVTFEEFLDDRNARRSAERAQDEER